MVYLLHYLTAISHAQHYLGFTDTDKRIELHAKGTSGAALPRAFHKCGITFVVARTWEGDRALERRLKNGHNARMLCPICRTNKLVHHAAINRASYARKKAA